MIFKQVTFVPVNKHCVTLKPIQYNIDTVFDDSARKKAQSLLDLEKYADRYKLGSIVDCVLHHHVC